MAIRLVLASHNPKKASELRAILSPLEIELLDLTAFPGAPEPIEDGATFSDNAVIKAESALNYTGIPALADDSGLVVDVLGGEPGVWSARFAGENAGDAANNQLLLKKLSGVPFEKRQARFVSVIAFARPGLDVRLFRGETHGHILERESGTGGFGYDPLFFSDDLGMTFAVAEAEAKNRVSHRGRALAELIRLLRAERVEA